MCARRSSPETSYVIVLLNSVHDDHILHQSHTILINLNHECIGTSLPCRCRIRRAFGPFGFAPNPRDFAIELFSRHVESWSIFQDACWVRPQRIAPIDRALLIVYSSAILCIGGPALVIYVSPTEEELFKACASPSQSHLIAMLTPSSGSIQNYRSETLNREDKGRKTSTTSLSNLRNTQNPISRSGLLPQKMRPVPEPKVLKSSKE